MTLCLFFIISCLSIILGFCSVAAWLYASVVKVSREEMVAERTKQAAKKGQKPNLAGVTLDGWDMSSTFAAQAKWNARGAALAACSIGFQAVG